MNLYEKEINDIYEAAFYITQGARFVSARTRTIKANSVEKLGYKIVWLIRLEGITHTSTIDWKAHRSIGNIREYANARINLKRKIKNYLNQLTKPTI